ncbi:MAG TPA: endonuclease/exonuclease/phosphatase family protein [Vicinamibacteria bacterium]
MPGRAAAAITVGLAAVLPLAGACVSNYGDPAGPFHETRHGDGRDLEAGLRVVTFNVERGRRVDQAIAALRTHPDLRTADVIALQEMSGQGVAAVARALRMNSAYFPASREPRGGPDWGNAILSPWPLEDARKLRLPHRSRLSRRARTATRARVLRPAGPVRVYSTHLGSVWGISEARRRDQAQAILADAAGATEPLVILGDFNSHELGRLFEGEGFCWPTRDVGPTVDRYSVDHVFARGVCGPPGSAAGVARDVTDASDHRPVWAVLGGPAP